MLSRFLLYLADYNNLRDQRDQREIFPENLIYIHSNQSASHCIPDF